MLARHAPGVGLPSVTDANTGADLLIDGETRADLLAYLAQLDESAGAPEDDCALHDECIVPDEGPGEPGDPNGPNGRADDVTPGRARLRLRESASDVGMLAIALAVLMRVRRRRST